MKNILFISAVNIHSGGGGLLLEALLNAIPRTLKSVVLVDSRFVLRANLPKNIEINYIKANVFNRLKAEYFLFKSVSADDIVLCFGNLPPLFKLMGSVVVFLQNRYLVENVTLKYFSLKQRLRLTIERFWFKCRLKNVDEFVVQTPTMAEFLKHRFVEKKEIQILPFAPITQKYNEATINSSINRNTLYDFLYVASGEPHKNHLNLLAAWKVLAKEGVYPSLCVTLDEEEFSDLCKLIQDVKENYGILVTNVGRLPHEDVLKLYAKSKAAVFPSKFESFGLPMIEARQAGLAILASELDFVRDILDPDQVFDPYSPLSIARAIKRFIGEGDKRLPLLNAAQFLNEILKLRNA
ncbi:glycosyltransferase family 4 protein [Polynucleobacter paneuropaeus]|jgi:glycosyltransferase involved in cell wall biosynthesis|nr:glycosyltransferase family 4 protein [Polynucleobacter paneuropaeus]MBT8610777.1 glycosyltransferase family 4 protein [Polynucleobacter paneuropaeus]